MKLASINSSLILSSLFFSFVGVFFLSAYESSVLGPYTRWFNERLEQKAKAAGLLGNTAKQALEVLGSPTYTRKGWDVTDLQGSPLPKSRFVITYEYFPYPWLPFSKFQVHTVNGKVTSLEKFDD